MAYKSGSRGCGSGNKRVIKSLEYLLANQHNDGGWRCKKFIFGIGPETEYSNPGPTLEALDAFRFTKHLNNNPLLDNAVEFLLYHWTVRKPLGPCHYGMGSLFMNLEYLFLRYNIFYYVYVLSFYNRAKQDARFMAALNFLKTKLIADQIIVENPNKKLDDLVFCKKGAASEPATYRFSEIINTKLHSKMY